MATFLILFGVSLCLWAVSAMIALKWPNPISKPASKKVIGFALLFGSLMLINGLAQQYGQPEEVSKVAEVTKPQAQLLDDADLPRRVSLAHMMIDQDESIKAADKPLLKAAAENVMRHDKKCLNVFTAGISLTEKGKYFVHCVNTESGFNVYFTKAEIESGQALAAPKAVSSDTAFVTCRDAVRSKLNHPSTFKSAFIPSDSQVYPQGHTMVELYFSAQNSFGLRTDMIGYCRVEPNGDVEILSIKERV